MGDMITMSAKEIDRVSVCKMLDKRLIKQGKAAKYLKITPRQVRRLVRKYKKDGEKGLISVKRGKPSNRVYSAEFKEKIKGLIETDYSGFGPSFAAEKLREINNINVSKETLRSYMIGWNIWRPKCGKNCSIHQQRARREYFGELVQIDGSLHDWFEGRDKKCCLIVFVDDATSKIVSMHFVPTENTQAYFECVKKYLKKHGRPWAFYSDRHGIFRVNKAGMKNKDTQFKRAMRELGIETICAHSAPAKGRVERANRTLQDRLIKEMRLKGISGIEAANEYVEEFITIYNKKFGKKPAKETDLHRKDMPSDLVLKAILCERYDRKLSQNLEFHFNKSIYQVIAQDTRGLKNMPIEICRFANGELKVWCRDKFVECKKFMERKEIQIASGKEINEVVDQIRTKDQAQAWTQVSLLRQINRVAQNG